MSELSPPRSPASPVVPTTPKSFRQTFASPKSVKSQFSEISLVSFVSDDEFSKMLIPSSAYTKESSFEILSQTLFDYSIDLVPLSSAITQIKKYRDSRFNIQHTYGNVVKLLYVSANLIPEVSLLLLTIAERLANCGKLGKINELNSCIKVATRLAKNSVVFQTYQKNQAKPKQKVQRILAALRKMKGIIETQEEYKDNLRQIQQNWNKTIEDKRNSKKNAAGESENEEEDLYIIDQLPLSHMPSVNIFLSSKQDLVGRKDRGSFYYKRLSPELQKMYDELTQLFIDWNKAYDSSQTIWEKMRNDDDFDVDILISRISISFADFLVEALITFAKNEGIETLDIQHPVLPE